MQDVERFIMKNHYEALVTEDAKFILEHAEKQLKDTLDTNDLIIGRLTTLVTITTALLVGLMGYATNRADTHGYMDRLVLTAFCGIVYLYIPATLIIINFLGKKYALIGSEPKEMFNDEVFKDENKTSLSKAIYCYEILDYQAKIKHNKSNNETRWKLFNWTLCLIFLTPLVLYLIYQFLIPLFSRIWC